jgi:hypothetical protein
MMRTKNNIKPIAKRFQNQISNLLNLYFEKMSATLLKEDISLDELNKVTASACKNLPDIFKLQETIRSIVEKKDLSDNNRLLNLISNDETASNLAKNLMRRISQISTND